MLRLKPAKRFKIPGKLAALSAALLMLTSPFSMQTIEGVNSVVLVSVPATAQGAGTGAPSGQQEEASSSGSPARLGLNLSRMIFKLY